jgi:hypothetical protein
LFNKAQLRRSALRSRDSVGCKPRSTQNQALNALVFLYREIVGGELGWIGDRGTSSRPNDRHGSRKS